MDRVSAGVLRVFGIIASPLKGALWDVHILGSSHCVVPEGGIFDGIADVEADKVFRFGLLHRVSRGASQDARKEVPRERAVWARCLLMR